MVTLQLDFDITRRVLDIYEDLFNKGFSFLESCDPEMAEGRLKALKKKGLNARVHPKYIMMNGFSDPNRVAIFIKK